MSYVAPEWIEYQRRRFIRPDAQRYWRPDADRLVPRETLKALSWQDPREAERRPDAAANVQSEAERFECRRELSKLRLDWELFKLSLRAQKALHPSNFQPRVPAGNSDGGQWTAEGAAGGQVRLAGPSSGANTTEISAARRANSILQIRCDALYALDTIVCNRAKSRACHEQASLRYSNCMSRRPIPPLNY
jgi:hypothetical protein